MKNRPEASLGFLRATSYSGVLSSGATPRISVGLCEHESGFFSGDLPCHVFMEVPALRFFRISSFSGQIFLLLSARSRSESLVLADEESMGNLKEGSGRRSPFFLD